MCREASALLKIMASEARSSNQLRVAQPRARHDCYATAAREATQGAQLTLRHIPRQCAGPDTKAGATAEIWSNQAAFVKIQNDIIPKVQAELIGKTCQKLTFVVEVANDGYVPSYVIQVWLGDVECTTGSDAGLWPAERRLCQREPTPTVLDSFCLLHHF